MIQSTWIASFEVSSFLVNSNKKLSLHGLISLMQEMAWSHAGHLGYGYARTRAQGGSWVIARQRIEVQRWPDWGETLTIRTWLRPPGSVIVVRDFEFLVGTEKVGEAAAHWLTISHQTRRPTRLPFSEDPAQFRQEGHLSIEPQKLTIDPPLQSLASYVVRPSDLDMNGHVNNTRFAQWVLDSLPMEFHEKYRLPRYQINFLAEVRPGEGLSVWGTPWVASGEQHSFLQGRRDSDGEVLFNVELEAST